MISATTFQPDETYLLPGDPNTWTPAERTRHERMAGFLRALQNEGMILAACKASGVSDATVWRWRDEYPAFGEAVTEFLKHKRVLMLEENLFRIAASTDPKTANAAVRANEILLRAYDPRFAATLKVEGTQTVNHIVQMSNEVRDNFRQRQLEKIRQIRTVDAAPASFDAPALPDGTQ